VAYDQARGRSSNHAPHTSSRPSGSHASTRAPAACNSTPPATPPAHRGQAEQLVAAHRRAQLAIGQSAGTGVAPQTAVPHQHHRPHDLAGVGLLQHALHGRKQRGWRQGR